MTQLADAPRAASCATRRARTREQAQAAGRSTTPSGTPRPTRATRCTTSRTPRRSSSRRCWRWTAWSKPTASGPSRDIFEENYFPVDAVPRRLRAAQPARHPQAGRTAPIEMLHRLGDERLDVQGQHDTVDAWVARGNDAVTRAADQPRLAAPCRSRRRPCGVTLATRRSRGGGVRSSGSTTSTRIRARLWHAMGEPEVSAPGAGGAAGGGLGARAGSRSRRTSTQDGTLRFDVRRGAAQRDGA